MLLKKYLAILLAGAAALPAAAQQLAQHGAAAVNRIVGRSALTRALQAEQFETPANKTTALIQRLIATSWYDEVGQLQDSARCYYSTPARGAAHNPKIPESYSAYFSPFANAYVDQSGVPYGRRQYVQPDSVRNFSLMSPGGVEQYTYTAANSVASIDRVYPGYRERFNLFYNSANDNVRCEHLFDTTFGAGAPVYVLTQTQYSAYDGQHQPVLDSFEGSMNGNLYRSRVQWTYNASGRVGTAVGHLWDGSALLPYSRATAVYLPNGLLQKIVSESWWGTAGWVTATVDSFGYSGANPSYTYYSSSSIYNSSGVMALDYYTTALLNGAGNWDTLRSYYYDANAAAFVEVSRVAIRYNSYQNWDRITEFYDLDSNGAIDPQPAYTTNYFYELYEPTSVNAVAAPPVCTVSPNPTSGVLRLSWNSGNTAARYTLTDLQGRILSTGSIAAGTPHAELDMTAQAPGIYILTLTDASGAILHRQKVVRQ